MQPATSSSRGARVATRQHTAHLLARLQLQLPMRKKRGLRKRQRRKPHSFEQEALSATFLSLAHEYPPAIKKCWNKATLQVPVAVHVAWMQSSLAYTLHCTGCSCS